jgi:hypothetical protein
VAKRRSFHDKLGKNSCRKSRGDLKNIGAARSWSKSVFEDDNLVEPIDPVSAFAIKEAASNEPFSATRVRQSVRPRLHRGRGIRE